MNSAPKSGTLHDPVSLRGGIPAGGTVRRRRSHSSAQHCSVPQAPRPATRAVQCCGSHSVLWGAIGVPGGLSCRWGSCVGGRCLPALRRSGARCTDSRAHGASQPLWWVAVRSCPALGGGGCVPAVRGCRMYGVVRRKKRFEGSQSSSISGFSMSCRSSAKKSSSLMADQSTCSLMPCGFPERADYKLPAVVPG